MNRAKAYQLFLLIAIVCLFSCKKNSGNNDDPTDDTKLKVSVTLESVSGVTTGTAIVKGSITLTQSKYHLIGQYMVCYDTSAQFATQNMIIHGNDNLKTTITIADTVKQLLPNANYYIRIRASITPTNSGGGDFYSEVSNITTLKFPLQIISLQPDSGTYQDQIVIKGKGFSWKNSDNQVFFNGIAATIKNIYADSLKVLVPKKCGTGAITIKLGNETANGPQFRYIDDQYIVYTIAGGNQGFVNGLGLNARFYKPSGLAFDIKGNIFVTEYGNNCIRKIGTDGMVTTFAGSGQQGYLNGSGTTAQFFGPVSVTVDQLSGNILVAEYGNPDVRIISADGTIVKTFAGCDTGGYKDGIGTKARFVGLGGIAQNTHGEFFVTETWGGRVRKIDGFGQVTTYAGDGTTGCKAGLGTQASIGWPEAIVPDANGNFYVSGNNGKTIFKIDTTSQVTIFSGQGSGKIGTFGYITGIAIDAQNNLLVTDGFANCVKKITPYGEITIFAGNPAESKMVDGGISKARFKNLNAIIMDVSGNYYILDDNCIRKIEKVD